jgi:outer membrane protein assembly factor BamD (BamD/ComL family)
VLVVIVGVGIYVTWRSQTDSRSREMLADAMTVAQAKVDPAPVPGAAPAPKPTGGFPTEQARNEAALARFVALANEYPSTDAGLEALYHAAATLTALGRYGESVQRYQEVIAKAGTSVYGQMAKLGIADTEVASGKYDQAIATYRELATSSVGNLPVDGVLMQLAYAYQAAGKTSDARQAFKRILDEFPQSPYAADAKRAMGELKG